MRLKKLKKEDRDDIIKEVIKRIEEAFEGSVVVWLGNGTPSDEYKDDTESFEAFMIKDNELERFIDFTWDLNESFTEPLGFLISVDALNPETTLKFRRAEYDEGRKRKIIQAPIQQVNFLTYGLLRSPTGRCNPSAGIPQEALEPLASKTSFGTSTGWYNRGSQDKRQSSLYLSQYSKAS